MNDFQTSVKAARKATNYTPDLIGNMDEMPIFFDIASSKTVAMTCRSEDNLLHSDIIALREDEATGDLFRGLEDEEDPIYNVRHHHSD